MMAPVSIQAKSTLKTPSSDPNTQQGT